MIVSTRTPLEVVAILLLVAANMSACASQSELNKNAKATLAAAAEKDNLDNGCFVIRTNEGKSNARKENVICPTVETLEEKTSK